jgi:hypothetical protein
MKIALGKNGHLGPLLQDRTIEFDEFPNSLAGRVRYSQFKLCVISKSIPTRDGHFITRPVVFAFQPAG